MHKFDGLLEFVTVVNHGGFTAAAKVLGVSASYVSRRISALEERLGVRLLHRTTRNVRLTDIGALYHERALAILSEIDTLEDNIADQQQLAVGSIRVSAGGVFADRFLAPALAEFASQHPRVHIHLDIVDRKVDMIGEGYGLAIRHGAPNDPDLIARRLTTRQMRVCGSPAYLDRAGRPETPQDLKNFECLTHPLLPWRFQAGGGEPFEVSVESRWSSNSGIALTEAAVTGLGLIRLANTYTDDLIERGKLEAVLSDYDLPPSTTHLVYPSRQRLPHRMRLLINFLVAHFNPAVPIPR
jgi:DNA-binding transcriptional LysR family regulator